MKQGMLNTFLLISLVSLSALAHAQSLGSTSTPQPVSSGASGITSAARSSWEGWLTIADPRRSGIGTPTIASRR